MLPEVQSRTFAERRQRLLNMLTRYATLLETADPPPSAISSPPVTAEASSSNSSNHNNSSAIRDKNTAPSPDLIDLNDSPAVSATTATQDSQQQSHQQQQQSPQQSQQPSWEVYSNWYIARRADMAAIEKVRRSFTSIYHLLSCPFHLTHPY